MKIGKWQNPCCLRPKREGTIDPVLAMQTLLQDLRLAIRLVAKNPASSAVIVVTLGLGIGATTAIFSMVNAVLLRPLPYPQADQLVQVRKEWQPPWLNQPETTTGMAFREVLAWRQDAQRLLEIAEYQARSASLARGDEAELVTCGRVSASFLPVLGIAPARGREFLPDEDRPGGPAVAILSHALWQRDFGMASDIVGQTIRLDDRPYLVVGVLPPGFRFTESYDVLLPLALRQGDLLAAPEVIGRLKAGTRPEQARHALDAIYQRVRDPRENGRIQVVNLHDHVVGNVRPSLLVYQMAVAFVLLIACANVANLLLARAVNRHKEMAIRLALGAGRMRLVRQLLTESLLLAALGALLGLLLALWGKDFLQSFVGTLPKLPAVRIDGWVLGVTLLMTVLTGVFCGLAPAMEASGGALTDRLKHGASGSTNAIVRQRHLTGLFVVLEVTLAVLLLVGSGLLIRSYLRLSGVNLGFHPDRILSLTIDLVKSRYPDARSQTTYFEQVIERLQLLPGVEAVGANVALPLTDAKMGFMETGAVSGRNIVSSGGIVSAVYFRTLDIPLRKVRWFADQDRRGAPLVVVVNESFVQRYFPDEEPLGKNVAGRTVIGVVGDVKAQGPMSAAESELYFHYLQAVDPNPSTERMSLAVRPATFFPSGSS